jgi:hypothetical protein
MATDPAAPAGRDVLPREAGRPLGLAVPRPFLVDRPGRDLLGAALRLAAFAQRLLDVLVLPSALRALPYASWRHVHSFLEDARGIPGVRRARNVARSLFRGSGSVESPRPVDAKGGRMYISGGLLALIIIIVLLVWLL